jgi:hypothetical protein
MIRPSCSANARTRCSIAAVVAADAVVVPLFVPADPSLRFAMKSALSSSSRPRVYRSTDYPSAAVRDIASIAAS